MSDVWEVNVHIDEKALNAKLENLIDDDVMLQCNNLLAQYCNEYVPFLEGPLSQTIEVSPRSVRYTTPYAHYQYFLHDMAADLAGETNRTRTYHPKATSFWDEAMLMEKGDAFKEQIRQVLLRKVKELYG